LSKSCSYAYDRDSSVRRLDKALDDAPNKGWGVIDMKKDWKTVLPSENDFVAIQPLGDRRQVSVAAKHLSRLLTIGTQRPPDPRPLAARPASLSLQNC
jgi:hypothetical protein